jgi:hypothetical protein
MPDNKEFCEQIGAALVNLGTNEALSCMARMMIAIAQKNGSDLEFNCDMGSVIVECKQIKLDS